MDSRRTTNWLLLSLLAASIEPGLLAVTLGAWLILHSWRAVQIYRGSIDLFGRWFKPGKRKSWKWAALSESEVNLELLLTELRELRREVRP